MDDLIKRLTDLYEEQLSSLSIADLRFAKRSAEDLLKELGPDDEFQAETTRKVIDDLNERLSRKTAHLN